MHGTLGETLKRLTELTNKIQAGHFNGCEIIIAPPFTALYSASIALQGKEIRLAAQNAHWESDGAFTGEVAPLFLKDVGCDYVIIGHSERRKIFKETDEIISKKLPAVLSADLKPIFCIGESLDEREGGKTFEVLERQLKMGLKELQMTDLKNMLIAYEPVWAIGTGKNATTEQIEEVHHFLRDQLGKSYDAPTANSIFLLYGGSVKADNASEILKAKNVDGVLVGGASLDVDQFVEIMQAKGE